MDSCGIADSPRALRYALPRGAALGAGRVGRPWLLRIAFAVLLGGCGYTWCAPRQGCRSCGRWPDPKLGEREVLAEMLEVEADVLADHEGTLLTTDKSFAARAFE